MKKELIRASVIALIAVLTVVMSFGTVVFAADENVTPGDSETTEPEDPAQQAEQPGWHTTESGGQYYVNADGTYAHGIVTIDKVKFVFAGTDPAVMGLLMTASKNTLRNVSGFRYFVSTKGKVLTGWTVSGKKILYFSLGSGKYVKSHKITIKARGWVLSGKKLYYFKSYRAMAQKGRTKDCVRFDKYGASVNNYDSKIKIKAMKVSKRLGLYNKKKSKAKRLRVAWKYMTTPSKFHYVGIYPDHINKASFHKVGYIMLNEGIGDCFGYSSAFAALASEIGYTPYIVYSKRVGGVYPTHSFDRINGKYYDPEAWNQRLSYTYGRTSWHSVYKIKKIIKFY